ncbi:oxygenase MpaB family protein [Kineococcus sp. G2]|uniref:oxygenase MpaB family protein n=1 Tax=Kineococcus sp. G2 TaxID=3127484 RepID=UPI00301E0057
MCTFGSAELAERDCARVRGVHRRVRGETADGRAYSARDADLLRWVHLAFTDAFLAAHRELGADLSGRFGPSWADAYVRDWARTARALGATDLPATEAELAGALAGCAPVLEPVPAGPAPVPARPAGPDPRGGAVLRGADGGRGAAAVAGAGAGRRRARPPPRPAARPGARGGGGGWRPPAPSCGRCAR